METNKDLRNNIYHQLMKKSGLILKGVLKENEPMSKHTTWRVGGLARQYYQPKDIEDLGCFLQQLPVDEPLLWLGLGSNLLVRDAGFDGTVISTSGVLDTMTLFHPYTLHVAAGVACPKLARFSAQQGLTGAEFFAGIPGTMGGALAMNAGAFGSETWTYVNSVETINRQGQRFKRKKDEFQISYRTVKQQTGDIENEWFVQAELQLAEDTQGTALQSIKNFIKQRAESQPMGLPSCGSVFRNPKDDYAARLIEGCGLKGLVIGGACVSTKHANFIINLGNAKAQDIEMLIGKIQSIVKEKYEITLIPEVRVVGEAQ